MNTPSDVLAEWQQRLQSYRAELDRLVGEVASELRHPPPRQSDEQATIARLRLIDASVMSFNMLLQQFSSAQAATSGASIDPQQNFVWHTLAREYNFVRSSVHRWHLVRSLVKEQLREPRYSLVRRRSAKLSARDIQDRLADDLFNALHLAIEQRQQHPSMTDLGAYPDIGLNNSAFAELMSAAHRLRLILGRNDSRFLDVGCGAGTKVMGAARYFHEVAGLEFDPGYVKVAGELLQRANLGRADVIQADALSYQNYDRFNIIYFFRPLRDHNKLLALERRITSTAKTQTLLIAPYVGFAQRYRSYNCQQITRHLFVVGLSRKEARLLKRRAEYCGLAVQPPRDPLAGVWQPILEASHANGFDLFRTGRLDGV